MNKIIRTRYWGIPDNEYDAKEDEYGHIDSYCEFEYADYVNKDDVYQNIIIKEI